MRNLVTSKFLLVSVSMILVLSGCTPASGEPIQTSASPQPENTSEANMPLSTDVPATIAQAEELAGFDVKVPTYLPAGAVLDSAVYEDVPNRRVTLYFKMIHETYGDMGVFFHIVQEPQAEALPNPTACGASGNDCETLQIGDLTAQYRLTPPTESLMWEEDGFSFQLLRTAGEPDKIYKDELLKVVGSME